MAYSPSTVQATVAKHAAPTTRASWIMLVARSGLFLGIQALFALGFYLAGSKDSWNLGAAWWPFAVTITNVVCLATLIRLYRAEGKNYWDVFCIRRENLKGDLLALLATFVVAGPAGYFPNILLAGWLFSDPLQALDLLVRPLPMWAVAASIALFPLTQGLVEIATYFIYVMPRLQPRGSRGWTAIILPSIFLGLQHFAVPFVFDVRFVAWRALMYLPFAFVVGGILYWRPRLLPYIAVVHVLMDLSFATMLLGAAY